MTNEEPSPENYAQNSRDVNDPPPHTTYTRAGPQTPSPYGPPPPYAASQPRVAYVFRSVSPIVGMMPAPNMVCPRCLQMTPITVHSGYSPMAYLASCLMCFSGIFMPCFWLPFCLPSCMETRYYCSVCGATVGRTNIVF